MANLGSMKDLGSIPVLLWNIGMDSGAALCVWKQMNLISNYQLDSRLMDWTFRIFLTLAKVGVVNVHQCCFERPLALYSREGFVDLKTKSSLECLHCQHWLSATPFISTKEVQILPTADLQRGTKNTTSLWKLHSGECFVSLNLLSALIQIQPSIDGLHAIFKIRMWI